jgi:CHAD domain-containing protein
LLKAYFGKMSNLRQYSLRNVDMKKSELVRVLDKRCRNLQQHKAQLRFGLNAEANHDFRVEIKKLRAFLRLLQQTQACPPELHLPRSFHQFYKAVGDVRSLQLQRVWVQSICKELACPEPTGYMAVLASSEKKARKQVREKAKEISVPWLHQQLVKALPATLRKRDAENFVQQKRTQLAGYLAAASVTDAVLHDIRKLLKDLLYVWPWIDGVMAEAFPPLFLTKANCLRLAERLGSYQDCCVSISLFSTTFLAGLGPDEQQRLAVIKERCCRKREKEKEAIIVTLLLLKNELQAKMSVQPNKSVATAG